ncbi:MAG: hypothetical protein O3A47_04725 [Chloroflexi bacterium]|nr:hypothetical protein [Chloroflexota bacterium]
MMTDALDPNEVRLTGENSYIRMTDEDGGPVLTRVSHWRVLLSPGGPGHMLFLKSDLTNDEVRLYSDNIALARWLQEEIERDPEYADQNIPVTEAVFSKSGDVVSFWTEMVDTEEESIALTWYDFGEPFVVDVPPDASRTHGVYSCLVPARRVQVTANGEVARGRAFPTVSFGAESSTSCLALSETWTRPR